MQCTYLECVCVWKITKLYFYTFISMAIFGLNELTISLLAAACILHEIINN